jgi:hypothetical protein
MYHFQNLESSLMTFSKQREKILFFPRAGGKLSIDWKIMNRHKA